MDPKTLHLVSGVSQKEIEKVLGGHRQNEIEQGYSRYAKPALMSTVDPSKVVSTASLDLAPKPTDWDTDIVMKWYITLIALALGVDYQDIAPLPSKGIGGSQQSLILHQKSKGKGPEHFMKTIEHIFNFHGIIPKNVTFQYEEKDIADELERADLLKATAEAHKIFVEAGIWTPQASLNIQLDEGLISQEIFDTLSQGMPDATEEVEATDDEQQLQQPGNQSQAVEDEQVKARMSDFDKRERIKWENAMAADMEIALKKIYRNIRKRLLPKKSLFEFGEKQTPESLMGDEKFWKEFRLVMSGAMQPNARRVFLGAAAFNQSLGLAVDMDMINLAALEFTGTYTTEWLAALEETTRDGLRKAITSWQQGKLGTEGLPDLVNSLEPLFGKARAQRIAQTETTRVFDLGNLESHRSAGIEYEQWQTANDERVRDEHAELQGQVFRLDEGPRPSDYINCRCARVPIAKPEAERILRI